MVEVGMFIYFIPPYFASGIKNKEYKKRLMLVIKKNEQDNTVTLINISKVKGKPNYFTYPFNVLIRKFNPPLPMLSFAKINDNYVVENFKGLSNFLYKNGQKIDEEEYSGSENLLPDTLIKTEPYYETNSYTVYKKQTK